MWTRVGFLLIAVGVLAAGQTTAHGRLLDLTGAPLRDAYVSGGATTLRMDSEGPYQIRFSATGRQTIEFQQPGFANLKIELDVKPSQVIELPDFTLRVAGCGFTDSSSQWRRLLTTLDRGGLRGDVRVLAKDGLELGDPVKNAKVTLLCSSKACGTATTDSLERYRFENLTPGAYTIRVEQPGFYPETEDVRVIGGFESVYDGYVAMLACISGNCIKNPRPLVAPSCE